MRALRASSIVVGYGMLFLAFDLAATRFEVAPGVSLWYPSAGLNLALVVRFGPRYLPAILGATLFSGLVISDPPIGIEHLILPNLLILLANGVGGVWLRRRLAATPSFGPAALGPFLLVAALLPLFVSALAVLSYTLTGQAAYDWSTFRDFFLSWWIADGAGVLTLTPLLLLTTRPDALRLLLPASGRAWAVMAVEAAGLAGVLGVAFGGAQHQLYLCFLPLLWIATRHGLPRTTLAVFLINTGALTFLHGRVPDAQVLELQLFVLALALTGLLLGAFASERQEALAALRSAHVTLEGQLEQRDDMLRATSRTLMSQIRRRQQAEEMLRRYVEELQHGQDRLKQDLQHLAGRHEALSSSADELRRLNDQKDHLLSLISHDLRGQYTSVMGYSDLLAEGAQEMPRPQLHGFAQDLQEIVRQFGGLLENLLTWARAQVAGGAAEVQPRNAYQLVQEVRTRLLAAAVGKEVAIQLDVPEDLYVDADAVALASVLQNLMNNALKFSFPGGTITVTARADDAAAVTFTVEDEGVGLTPEACAALFEVRARTSKPGTAGETGTGLGLLLCQEMVTQRGGRIWAESISGRGARFCFTWPAVAQAEASAGDVYEVSMTRP